MNVTLTTKEAAATVAALRLRATIIDQPLRGLPFTAAWTKHEVALLTEVADSIELAAAIEIARELAWLDRKAAYDAMQSADITEARR